MALGDGGGNGGGNDGGRLTVAAHTIGNTVDSTKGMCLSMFDMVPIHFRMPSSVSRSCPTRISQFITFCFWPLALGQSQLRRFENHLLCL